MLGLIIINWNAFNGKPELEQMRCFVVIFMILAIVLNLSLVGMSNSSSGIDYTGHLGGSIVGIIWSFAFFPRVKSPSGNKFRIAGIVLTSVFFLLLTILLFTVIVKK